MKTVTIGNATLYCGPCEDVLPLIGKVDCVLTDPPYCGVKGDYWDNEWDSDHEFLDWMRGIVGLLANTMKPNASLYLFASPQMAARVECVIRDRLTVLNHAVWRKGRNSMRETSRGNMAGKENLRAFFASTERIIFAEVNGSDDAAQVNSGYRAKCDEAARDTFGKYVTATRLRYGLTMKDLTAAVGAHGKVNHGGACSNWEAGNNVPTLDHYKALQSNYPGCFSREYEELRREYEELRREYEELRREYEELRRPFNLTAKDQWSDVWEFDPVSAYAGKHPCEKPVPLLAHMLNISTKPGATVLDAFMGSGATGDVAIQLGRKFIGIERDERYFEIACRRIEQAATQGQLFAPARPAQPEQVNLFAAA